MEITFRPAADNDDDAMFVSWGFNEATSGMMDLMLGKRREIILADVCRMPGHDMSLEHITIAELNGRSVGMLSGMSAEETTDPFFAFRKAAGIRFIRFLFFGILGYPLFESMSKHSPGEWYIQALAVRPEARGQGVGSRLLSLAAQKAGARGCGRITLDVSDDNPGGIRLYSRFGFTVERVSSPARLLRGIRAHRMTKPV